MILQGSQRGGARDLALHLLKDENDHVEVHELRGFVSDDLVSALNEVHAISRGTKTKQFLFSLSLNPPPEENVSNQDFEDAIDRVEDKLGLTGQPRAIAFHEKQGRRHCHTVWSRIDSENMKAIPLPFTKYKLRDLSRELFIEHGWKMPEGYTNSKERDPKNFTLAHWQQAKRIGKDPREIKAAMQDSWVTSDTQGTFQQALKDRGYTLARGDRRGIVALDHRCEIYAVPKWVGVRAKEVRSRITDQDSLPTVVEARAQIAKDMEGHLSSLRRLQDDVIKARLTEVEQRRVQLVNRQVAERETLKEAQQARWNAETRQRQERFNKGLRGLLERVTGQRRLIKEQNEIETCRAYDRDRKEKDSLIFNQLKQRRALLARTERLQAFREHRAQVLSRDMGQYQEIRERKREVADFKQRLKHRQPVCRPDLER